MRLRNLLTVLKAFFTQLSIRAPFTAERLRLLLLAITYMVIAVPVIVLATVIEIDPNNNQLLLWLGFFILPGIPTMLVWSKLKL